LILDDTLYTSMFNGPFSAMFVELFDSYNKGGNYLLLIVIPYLEFYHHSRYGVATFVLENPFDRIRSSTHNDLRQYKMLYQCCNDRCDVSYCTNAKMNMKKKM
jgi:hypothetical protein